VASGRPGTSPYGPVCWRDQFGADGEVAVQAKKEQEWRWGQPDKVPCSSGGAGKNLYVALASDLTGIVDV
jgi:hypothetical protein